MGKIKIKLNPNGSLEMITEGIKGSKCMDYAKVLERLADVKINKIEKTKEYYETSEVINDDEIQHIREF